MQLLPCCGAGASDFNGCAPAYQWCREDSITSRPRVRTILDRWLGVNGSQPYVMGSGNRGPQCKNWCFTSYNIENEPNFSGTSFEYLVYGRETCPSTNRQHWQGFISFTNRQRLSSLKKMDATAHFERMRGTPKEAAEYCKKDKDFKEFGELPKVSKSTSGFRAVLDAAENGDIESIKNEYPGMYIRYKATISSVRKFTVKELSNTSGVWICGPPRTSKDYAVRKLGDFYLKNLNKWWDGYKDEANVLISDVEPSHASWLGYFLKIWCDRYPFNAEIKGGSMLIRPRNVFITSNFLLEQCFDGKILEALEQRMEIFNRFCDPIEVTRRPVIAPSESVYEALKEFGYVSSEISTPSIVSTETAAVSTEVSSDEDFEITTKKQVKFRKIIV